jgi:glycosyltransferase involved in cell wall biosynthesis
MNIKIGVGVITCNRPAMFERLMKSLPQNKIDELVVVNDGKEIDASNCETATLYNTQGSGVGNAKNKALQHLIKAGCDYIFLIEDDMLIKSDDIFDAYIKASKSTGIQHFLFGYHGPANKNGVSGGSPVPRTIMEYPDGVKVALNQHCVGAFCMYTAKSLQDVGLFDCSFHNAFEHVHHSYLLCKKNYCVEYWWWPDLANSLDYIQEQACSEHNSSIRPRTDWQNNIRKGFEHFIKLEGVSPVQITDASLEKVKAKLKQLINQ